MDPLINPQFNKVFNEVFVLGASTGTLMLIDCPGAKTWVSDCIIELDVQLGEETIDGEPFVICVLLALEAFPTFLMLNEIVPGCPEAKFILLSEGATENTGELGTVMVHDMPWSEKYPSAVPSRIGLTYSWYEPALKPSGAVKLNVNFMICPG